MVSLGEPDIQALVRYIRLKRAHDTHARCIPPDSSGSNLLVEARIKEAQSQCRTLRLSLMSRYKITIDSDHVLVAMAGETQRMEVEQVPDRGERPQRVLPAQCGEWPERGRRVRRDRPLQGELPDAADRRMPGSEQKHKADSTWYHGIWWG